MSEETLKLVNTLAPLATELIIRGGQVIATFAENMTVDQLADRLQSSKSESWPKLDFKPE